MRGFDVGFVTLEEIVKCLRVLHSGLRLAWRWTFHLLVLISTIPQPTILLVTKRGHIFDFLCTLHDGFPRLILHLFHPVLLLLLFLLLVGHFRLDRCQLLFIPIFDGLSACLFCFGLLQNLLFSFLVELQLFFGRHYNHRYSILLVLLG